MNTNYGPGGDPIDRLKQHMEKIGIWDSNQHDALIQKIDDEVMTAYKKACEFGDLANGPYPPAVPFSQKFTKKFLGMSKNKERS